MTLLFIFFLSFLLSALAGKSGVFPGDFPGVLPGVFSGLFSGVFPGLFASVFPGVFLCLFFDLFLTRFLAPVPLRSRTEDSVTVALIHLAAEKGPVIALAIAGVVLLALLFREGMMLFFWWTRLKIKRYATGCYIRSIATTVLTVDYVV